MLSKGSLDCRWLDIQKYFLTAKLFNALINSKQCYCLSPGSRLGQIMSCLLETGSISLLFENGVHRGVGTPATAWRHFSPPRAYSSLHLH